MRFLPEGVRHIGEIRWRSIVCARWSVVFVALTATTTAAQRVHRTVADALTNAPIAGTVVWFADSSGGMLTRTISNDGGFALRRPTGAAQLHAVRIGYRPFVRALSPADSIVALRLEPLPAMLSGVTTLGRRICPGDKRADEGFDLWDQARAALLASVVSRELHPPLVRLLSHERTIDPLSRRVVHQTANAKEMLVDRSYVAGRSATAFSVLGYMLEEGSDRIFYAPDNETLLDPTFANTHCLAAIPADRDHAGQLGIAFEPTREGFRDTLVDVRGALWLDPESPALRSIEFTYTGLEPAARESGGEVTFAQMPNGTSLVQHWSIHTAIIAVDESRDDGIRRRPPPRELRRNRRVTALHEAGGDVASASWPDGTSWHGEYPRIVGLLTDAAGEPVVGARVWIAKSRDTVTTDSAGRFAFPYMSPGLYAVLGSDSVLAAAGLSLTTTNWVALDGSMEKHVRLAMFPRTEVLRQLCGAATYVPGMGVVIGTATDAVGNPAAKARIDVWQRYQTARVELFRQVNVGEAGPDGRFVICGTPFDQRIRVRLSTATESAEFVVDWTSDVFAARVVLRPTP
ncbi:MAG: carboxypeptidase regulatory-like domain-containing protein [Gemmatimonadota bacterium]